MLQLESEYGDVWIMVGCKIVKSITGVAGLYWNGISEGYG